MNNIFTNNCRVWQVLVFDTQMLMGGKKYELSPEEHIYAALNIYLDIVQLFLILLCLLGGGGDS